MQKKVENSEKWYKTKQMSYSDWSSSKFSQILFSIVTNYRYLVG